MKLDPSILVYFDFDGTLFNTLSVHFKIAKRKITDGQQILQLHRDYIDRQFPVLNEYAQVWSEEFDFLLLKGTKLILISGSSGSVINCYLEKFGLFNYFTTIAGNLPSSSARRKAAIIRFMIEQKASPVFLVSDNPEDGLLNLGTLVYIDGRKLHSEGLQEFRSQVREILEKISYHSRLPPERESCLSKGIKS